MGKVRAVKTPGLRCFINSNDHHPPHVHVQKPGEWMIRVFLLEITRQDLRYEVVWSKKDGRPRPGDLQALHQELLQHREEVIEQFEREVLDDV